MSCPLSHTLYRKGWGISQTCPGSNELNDLPNRKSKLPQFYELCKPVLIVKIWHVQYSFKLYFNLLIKPKTFFFCSLSVGNCLFAMQLIDVKQTLNKWALNVTSSYFLCVTGLCCCCCLPATLDYVSWPWRSSWHPSGLCQTSPYRAGKTISVFYSSRQPFIREHALQGGCQRVKSF